MNLRLFCLIFLPLLASKRISRAATVENSSNTIAGGAGLTVSATDLVNQGQPSFASYTSSNTPQFGTDTVNNGVATNLTTAAAFYSVANSRLPTTLVFNLNIVTNTAGYDITRIDSFAGWEAGGTQTYANQKFTMEYSVVGSDDWLPLTAVDYSPFTSTTSNTPAYTRSSLSDRSGFLATGVDAIRFVYSIPSISGGSNAGTVIQEIDIVGVPTGGGIVIENTSNSVPGGAGLAVSSTDLVNQGQPTFLNYTSSKTPQFGAGSVNNGVATNLTTAAAFYRTDGGLLPTTLDFNLDVSINTGGYDITKIDSFAGWEGGGTQTYGNQKFTVEYSVVGDSGFIPLAGVDYSPFTSTTSNTPAYSRSRITRSNGVLVSGVDALRVIYSVPTVSGGGNGGLVIQEIDVHGLPNGPDTTAPSPNPMSFSIAPYASSTTSIAMEATHATDSSGVEYYFAETSGNPGGSDSGWQVSANYEDAA